MKKAFLVVFLLTLTAGSLLGQGKVTLFEIMDATGGDSSVGQKSDTGLFMVGLPVYFHLRRLSFECTKGCEESENLDSNVKGPPLGFQFHYVSPPLISNLGLGISLISFSQEIGGAFPSPFDTLDNLSLVHNIAELSLLTNVKNGLIFGGGIAYSRTNAICDNCFAEVRSPIQITFPKLGYRGEHFGVLLTHTFITGEADINLDVGASRAISRKIDGSFTWKGNLFSINFILSF